MFEYEIFIKGKKYSMIVTNIVFENGGIWARDDLSFSLNHNYVSTFIPYYNIDKIQKTKQEENGGG